MSKFFKIIKTFQESIKRKSPSSHCCQPSKYLLSPFVEADPACKRLKSRRENIKNIQGSICCLGRNLDTFLLSEIPPILIFTRGLSSRYMTPEKSISKTESKRISEENSFIIMPAWMKKTKIKKFQDRSGKNKNKNLMSQNKSVHVYNVSQSKFKLTSLLNTKSNTIQLMREALKQKKFYKAVLDKISVPHFETKHIVLKKKNNKKESLVSLNSLKEQAKGTDPANYKLTVTKSIENDHDSSKQAEEIVTSRPVTTIENNEEKSLMVVSENKPKQPNSLEDRSRVRRYKTQNAISEKDEKLLKLKAKYFEKPEVDLYIKKLAAKYGKATAQKNVKPKRIYENNRQRIKYDLNADKEHVTNLAKVSSMIKHATPGKLDKKISHYSKKHLNEFIKNNVGNIKILKKGNNLLGHLKSSSHKVEEKPKRSTILRKEDFISDMKLQTGTKLMNNKVNTTINLNSKNGFLKHKDKQITTTENTIKKLETESSSNSVSVKDDEKGEDSLNGPEEKNQNMNQIDKGQTITYISQNTGEQQTVDNSNGTKIQKEVIPTTDGTCTSSNVKKITDDESDTLSNKRNEFSAKIENMSKKNKKTQDQTIEALGNKSKALSRTINKDKYQHTVSKVDTTSKPTEQMKYMKFTPDSQNYICNPKKGISSCKYKLSRGVHSDKSDKSSDTKMYLKNTQPDLEPNNEMISNQKSDNSNEKIEAASVNEIVNLPIKFIKKPSIPEKIYKFHCHRESLDYKVYKLCSSPSMYSDPKQDITVKPKINEIQTRNLENINNLNRKGNECFDIKKGHLDVKKGKLINVNTVRKRLPPPMLNLKYEELVSKSEVTPVTAKQSDIHSNRFTKRENLPLINYRFHGAESQHVNSENLTKQDLSVYRHKEQNSVMHLEEVEVEKHTEGKENINFTHSIKKLVNNHDSHISNLRLVKEKPKYVNTKIRSASTINLEKQTKIEDVQSKNRTNIDKKACLTKHGPYEIMDQTMHNKMFHPILRESFKPDGYRIDYSCMELKNILPFLNHELNKPTNNCSKALLNSANKKEPLLPLANIGKKEERNVLFNENTAYKRDKEELKMQNPNMITDMQIKQHKSQLDQKSYKSGEYNINYSRMELKNIQSFLAANKTMDSGSKGGNNPGSKETNKEQLAKEKKLPWEKETTQGIKKTTQASSDDLSNKNRFMPPNNAMKIKPSLNNKEHNQNFLCKAYIEKLTKKDELQNSITDNINVDIEKNKQLEMQLGNCSESMSISNQEIDKISQQGVVLDSKALLKRNNKKEPLLPLSNIEKKKDINLPSSKNTNYKQNKEELDIKHQNMITDMQIKQHKTQTGQKSALCMDEPGYKFFDLISNKNILNEKVRKNVFLMHGFNKISFLKIVKEIQQLNQEMNNIPENHAINTNTDKNEYCKSKINEFEILENDFKTMAYKQLELYNAEMRCKYLETIKRKENFKTYNLPHCTFLLQSFNKVSFNCEPPKYILENDSHQSNVTSTNDSVFSNETTEKKHNKTIRQGREYNKDVSFLEALDSRMPGKRTTSTKKESNTDDIGSPMINLVDSKHMCFYSKYRMNCMGDKGIIENEQDDTLVQRNTDNIKQEDITYYKTNNLKSSQMSFSQEIPASPINKKKLKFQETNEYNHINNTENKNQVSKVNQSFMSEEKDYFGVLNNLEKEFLLTVKQEDKNTPYTYVGLEPSRSYLSLKEHPNTGKIEPEVLHYMRKLDTLLTSKKGIKTMSSNTDVQDKNNEAFNTIEQNQKKVFEGNEPNEQSRSKKVKDVVLNLYGEKINTGNHKYFIKKFSYSSDIKLLEKTRIDYSDVINECRRGSFKYLTKAIQKHKMDIQNMSSLASSSNINEKIKKSDEVIPSKYHTDIVNTKNTSSLVSILVDPAFKLNTESGISKNRPDIITEPNIVYKDTGKMNNKNSIESKILKAPKQERKTNTELNISPNVKTVSLNKITQDESNPVMNSYQNNSSSELVKSDVGKLVVLKTVKEQEKLLFHLKYVEDTPLPKKNGKSTRTGDSNPNATGNANVKFQLNVNNLQNTVNKPIENNEKNELVSSVNTKPIDKIVPNASGNENKKFQSKVNNVQNRVNVPIENNELVSSVNTKPIHKTVSNASGNENVKFQLKVNNVQNRVNVPIEKNELVSSVNTKPMAKISSDNKINDVRREKSELGSKTKLIKSMNNVNTREKTSFEDMCNRNQKESRNIIRKDNCNFSATKNMQHLDTNTSRNGNPPSMNICKVNNVLNKKYGLTIQKDVNKEAPSYLTREEPKNLTNTLNSQNIQRNLEKTNDIDMMNERFTGENRNAIQEKMNISDITKPVITNHKNNEQHITNINTNSDVNFMDGIKPITSQMINDQKDFKTIVKKNMEISSINQNQITESIPLGLKCIGKFKVESEKRQFKKSECFVEPIMLRDGEKKHIRLSPSTEPISKSVAITKPSITTDLGSTTKLNKCLLNHKKQHYDNSLTKDKTAKSIKTKLSKNLKPKDDTKIIQKNHTLMSLINAENDKRKSDADNKSDTIKEKRSRLHSQRSSNNILSIPVELNEQTGQPRNTNFRAPETDHISNNNFFLDCKDDAIKISTEGKKSPLDIIYSENNFKQTNKHKDNSLIKAENTGINFTQREVIVKKIKNKETNSTHSTMKLHSSQRNMKTNKKSKYRDNPIYILKAQPKVEGFISQTLRSSNSHPCPSAKLYTGIIKKRQTVGHSIKHRTKSEHKQISATCLKNKISKYRTLKTDPRFNKNDLKKNKKNFTISKSNNIFSQKELPLHVFQKEQKKYRSKNYLLETPSRQVCGLIPPRRVHKVKSLMPKAKVTTKLLVCTKQTNDVQKPNLKIEENVKNCRSDDFTNKIQNVKLEKDHNPTFREMCLIEKEKNSQIKLTPAQNQNEDNFDNSESGGNIQKCISKDQNNNLGETKDRTFALTSDCDNEQIINLTKQTWLATKVSDETEVSKMEIINKKKGTKEERLPSIVGTVVNNVKAKLQNFLSSDIVKSNKLLKGTRSKKRRKETDNFKEKTSATKIAEISLNTNREKNGLAKLKRKEKQILSSTLISGANDIPNQVQLNKTTEKRNINPTNINRDTFQRKKISELLQLKSARNKRTCPQKSYSEVLNKFYDGYETQPVK